MHQNEEFIEYLPLPSEVLVKRGEDRYKVYYPKWMIDRPSNITKRLIRIFYREFILLTKIFKRNLSNVENIYFGSQWFSITGECLDHIIRYLDDESNYIKFFNNTIYADEMFFQTIIMNSYLKNNVKNNNLRYIDWSKGGNSPKILTLEDMGLINNSTQLIARKFDIDIDRNILMNLVEILNKKVEWEIK